MKIHFQLKVGTSILDRLKFGLPLSSAWWKTISSRNHSPSKGEQEKNKSAVLKTNFVMFWKFVLSFLVSCELLNKVQYLDEKYLRKDRARIRVPQFSLCVFVFGGKFFIMLCESKIRTTDVIHLTQISTWHDRCHPSYSDINLARRMSSILLIYQPGTTDVIHLTLILFIFVSGCCRLC